MPLLQRFLEIDEILFLDDVDANVNAGWDVEIEMMELAYVFRSTLETIPRDVPYLRVSEHAFEHAKAACSLDAFRVGLAWSSGDWNKERNVRLEQLACLSRVNENRSLAFFSLQQGDAAREISECPQLRIIDREGECESVMDTAATIVHMDLVISVDTMVAHLAGALGIPISILLPFCADWRWMIGRNDSPLYPTMRLLCQQSPGEWEPVIQEIASALSVECQE